MKKTTLLFAAVLAAMVSCTDKLDGVITDELGTEFLNSGDGESVVAVGEDFVMADPETKTTITQSGSNPPAFAWKEGDVIGIIPMNGKNIQANYEMEEIGEDPRTAVFDGGVWALKEGKEYAAYYPFKKEAVISDESICFSFTGQTQNANNSLAHLGDYDFMYANSVIPDQGRAQFIFSHKISLLRIQMTVPATDTFSSVVLESPEDWFTTTASLKLSDGTMTAMESKRSTTISLGNIEVSGNGVLTVWLAMLPTSAIEGQSLFVNLDGDIGSYVGEITGLASFAAGNAYTYSCDVTEASEPVDLGLSVKWAKYNLGASKPWEYGGYYQWAGTNDFRDKSNYLDWSNCPRHIGSDSETGWTKYIPSDKYSYWGDSGSPDEKTVLDQEDDAANVILGGRWRMPTDAEWTELRENCTWTWTTAYGVNGYKVTSNKTGYTDKSIFLPAAGYRSGDLLSLDGTEGYYSSSSLYTEIPNCAWSADLNSGAAGMTCRDRRYGQSVRPVYVESHTHRIGKVVGLEPTVTSSGWKDYYCCVEIADPCGTYWEDAEGTVLIGDEAALQVWKSEGGNGYIAPLPQYVDLGLSVKWATCNLGASRPREYGGYYPWAGTNDVSATYTYLDWRNCPYHTGLDMQAQWMKYIPSNLPTYWSGIGSPDNKAVLDPEDDAANVILGGSWRMPTDAELTELLENCTWTWSANYNGSGVAGMIVTSNKTGYTDKSIFLPAAGYRDEQYLKQVGIDGCYLSSTLDTEVPIYGRRIVFYSTDAGRGIGARYEGQSIRPVLGNE